ncbi:hypothetical protein DL89DRAFT_270753 [Linderina pennispora]|uniref:Uncharacterized protein n=1 Tax=Linderina pennispora TaxID=61395 RepID=A0A1Y1VXH5_9FUNG|nr:uncharacterized protein DL89DRAFT_270753 [Linderina pennispora]ORX65696.1 hypothetical protein DL89DRAFT_270753 [Linderina pennispora]
MALLGRQQQVGFCSQLLSLPVPEAQWPTLSIASVDLFALHTLSIQNGPLCLSAKIKGEELDTNTIVCAEREPLLCAWSNRKLVVR